MVAFWTVMVLCVAGMLAALACPAVVQANSRVDWIADPETDGASPSSGQLRFKPVTAGGLFHAVLAAMGRHGDVGEMETEEQDAFPGPSMRGVRVLLVDDNLFNQEVARAILDQVEEDTEVACNGLEALQRLEDGESYDVVLMDMTMPVMDGLEASRRIRAMDKFRRLPIIAMTANAMNGDREACLAAGMNDHLAKPIDTRELFCVLEKWIAGSPRTND